MNWNYLVSRAKERSTWIGLTAVLSGLGLFISPAHIEVIASLGVAVAGAIAAMTKDDK